MSRLHLRSFDAKSLLPSGIHDILFKGKVADSLGLFGLSVLILGLICFWDTDSMSIQATGNLQSLGFLVLGTGQLFFLRRKLPYLLRKRVQLFSREGWYYIGTLCLLLIVLLSLLYLIIDSNYLYMAGVSLFAFLLPFTVHNAWEIFRVRGQATAERKKIRMRAGLLCGVSLLLFVIGLVSLSGRQKAVPSWSNPEPLPKRLEGRVERLESKVGIYEKAGLVLNAYASHLLELDARFTNLARKDVPASPVELAKTKDEIKAQQYALGQLLDSLDREGQEFSPLTRPFRSLLGGHRILFRFQDDWQQRDYAAKAQSDSFRDVSGVR